MDAGREAASTEQSARRDPGTVRKAKCRARRDSCPVQALSDADGAIRRQRRAGSIEIGAIRGRCGRPSVEREAIRDRCEERGVRARRNPAQTPRQKVLSTKRSFRSNPKRSKRAARTDRSARSDPGSAQGGKRRERSNPGEARKAKYRAWSNLRMVRSAEVLQHGVRRGQHRHSMSTTEQSVYSIGSKCRAGSNP